MLIGRPPSPPLIAAKYLNSFKYLSKSQNRSHTDTAMKCVLLSELPAVKDAAVNYRPLNTPVAQFAPPPAAIHQKQTLLLQRWHIL